MSKTTSTTSSPASKPWAGSAAEWRGTRNHHQAELPSGMRIEFRMVSLAELFELDALPTDLLDLALREYGDPGSAFRLIAETVDLPEDAPADQHELAQERAQKIGRDLAELNRQLCALALLEPKLSAEELADPAVPYPDIEMLSGFVTRRVGFDAAGRRIGVEPLQTFGPFPDRHGCPSGCPECEAARHDLSTIQP